MFNPPPGPNSYADVLKRMLRRVQKNKVDDQILETIQQVFERELGMENAVLSRPERVRLYQQIARTILTDALEKIDRTKK